MRSYCWCQAMVTLLFAAAESAADAYGLVGTIGLSCAADRAASVSVSFFDRVRDKKKPPGLEAHAHHDRRSGSKITNEVHATNDDFCAPRGAATTRKWPKHTCHHCANGTRSVGRSDLSCLWRLCDRDSKDNLYRWKYVVRRVRPPERYTIGPGGIFLVPPSRNALAGRFC